MDRVRVTLGLRGSMLILNVITLYVTLDIVRLRFGLWMGIHLDIGYAWA